jgi:hypothetical protein
MWANLSRFRNVLHAVAALALSLLVSCSTARPYKGEATYRDADGNLVCTMHRQKVIEEDGYRQSDKICVLPSPDYTKWRVAFPNPHPFSVSDKKSAYYFEPVHYHYCRAYYAAISAKMEQEVKRRQFFSNFRLKSAG